MSIPGMGDFHHGLLVSFARGLLTPRFASRIDTIEDNTRRLGAWEGIGGVQSIGLNESADLVSHRAHAGEDAWPEGPPHQLAESGLDRSEP